MNVGTLGGSPASGASSTEARGAPDRSWTSGSEGSRATSGSGSGALGFVSLGSFPSRMALRIRAAFHLANLIFLTTSGSGSPHSRVRSKNVAAASNVSAVCLRLLVSPYNPVKDDIPRHLVGAHRALSSLKRLLSELLNISLSRSVIDDRIIISSFRLCCLEALDQCLCELKGIVVGGMQALAHDLVDSMVFT